MVGDGDWRVVIQVPVEGRVARFFLMSKHQQKRPKTANKITERSQTLY